MSYNDLLFAGYLEELRISHVARYTANFTPQITPFTSDANTKLLLHFDGGEGSVAFTDSGNTGHTVTAAGNAIQVIGHGATAAGNVKTENTQKKFGTTAAYFDGTGDYITLPDSLDYSFGTEPWTIDMWVNFSSIAAHSGFFEQYADVNNFIVFYRHTNTNTQFWAVVGGVYKAGYYWAWTPSLDTWYHMAIVRNGTDFSIYVDGVAQSLTVVNAIGSNAMPNIAAPMIIGKTVSAPALMNGDIDELRISKGIARWTANFTPPTKAYS